MSALGVVVSLSVACQNDVGLRSVPLEKLGQTTRADLSIFDLF